MFVHSFKYALKTLFRNRMMVFWTYAFPIIMGTFFYMAFSNIEKDEKLDIINIAIVDDEAFRDNEAFVESFRELSDENSDNQMFSTKYVTREEAESLLKEGEIDGYLVMEKDEPKIVVVSSGINETIFKYVVEEIEQTSNIVENVVQTSIKSATPQQLSNMEEFIRSLYEEVLTMISSEDSGIHDISSKNMSYTMIEFYTLIAMACLYGGLIGMVAVNANLPNMSNMGKRVSVSPVTKRSLLSANILASYIVQIIGVALLFAYLILALKVDFGDRLGFIILLALVGSLAGLSMGIFVAGIFKTNENAKTGILISVTMLGCFLSGMMGITMKYIVDKNVPIVNRLNPANMITDGFYALYYYEKMDRFYFDLVSLFVFSAILILISVMALRRQKYDSI